MHTPGVLLPFVSDRHAHRENIMAKTKQTAQRIIGGRTPRIRILATAARRAPRLRNQVLFYLSHRNDFWKVMMSSTGSIGEREPPFHIWVRVRDRRYDVTRDEFESLLGFHITVYLFNCPTLRLPSPKCSVLFSRMQCTTTTATGHTLGESGT